MQEGEGEKWRHKGTIEEAPRRVQGKAKARAMHEERRCANCTKRKAKSESRGEQLKHHAVCEEFEAKARSKREGGLKCDACGKHRARKEFSVREEEKRGRKKCKVHEAKQE